MKQSEIIRHIVIEQGIKWLTLASRLGVSQNNLSIRIARGTMSVDTYVDVLHALNYKLVAVPDSAKLPREAYEVTTE